MGVIYKNKVKYAGGGIASNDYSEVEQVIGNWINGKTLYQKTCVYENTGGVLATNAWTSLAVNDLPTDIETQVEMQVSNGACTLPIAAGVNNGVIRYFSSAAYGYDKLYFTIKYTKGNN